MAMWGVPRIDWKVYHELMDLHLTFNDSDRAEEAKFRRALTADRAYRVINEILEEIADICDNDMGYYQEIEINVVEKLREKVIEIIEDNGINLELCYE